MSSEVPRNKNSSVAICPLVARGSSGWTEALQFSISFWPSVDALFFITSEVGGLGIGFYIMGVHELDIQHSTPDCARQHIILLVQCPVKLEVYCATLP